MTDTDLSVSIDRELTKEQLTRDFLDYLLRLYRRKFRSLSRRYKGSWEPRSEVFDTFLLSRGITKRHPDISSLIDHSIRLRETTSNYILGIDPRKYYPNSKVRLIDYVRWIEFGTSEVQARPLLTVVKRDLESNFKKYYFDVIGGKDK